MTHSAEKVLESRALQSLLDRIHDERDEVERWERHLADAKRRRDALLRKGLHAGLSTRFLERHAGISNVTIGKLQRANP